MWWDSHFLAKMALNGTPTLLKEAIFFFMVGLPIFGKEGSHWDSYFQNPSKNSVDPYPLPCSMILDLDMS